MKIVVLDGGKLNPGDLSWEGLDRLGDVTVFSEAQQDRIPEYISDAEAVLVNKIPLSSDNMKYASKLRYIGVMATGYNIVDLDFARAHGITVTNVPDYGTEAVSQYAISLLLEITGRVGHHSDVVREGRWIESRQWCFWDYPLIELAGKTMGIIGFGKIGQRTGEIAKALGMNVIYNSRTRKPDLEKQGFGYRPIDELLPESDVVVLHCPLFPETRNIINETTISKMKDGVIIINNSRGQLIDEKALAKALESGKVRAAGLDVVSVEPMESANPLYGCRNCFITPHISWAPKETRQRLLSLVVENLRSFISGESVNVVS